jgi:hypothetical protein
MTSITTTTPRTTTAAPDHRLDQVLVDVGAWPRPLGTTPAATAWS